MSWCDRSLADHVDCVKAFLRDARTNDLIYAPGTHGEHDRCTGTRNAFVECAADPKRRGIQRGFSYFLGQEMHGGPKACEAELVLHGKCIEKNVRDAACKGDQPYYAFMNPDAPDKCAKSRLRFDKCMEETIAIKASSMEDPTKGTRR
eukprot:NODE_4188_length_701_cov_359.150155.p1 GENE.NODE_4188_length_701_cov_359.150155~~NODE_4188_length_701_cov_359.150155.p1  ORF type:complete len:148 (+),score=32.50 NODE_4188_length_701_cov_359.150155:102-545(+)